MLPRWCLTHRQEEVVCKYGLRGKAWEIWFCKRSTWYWRWERLGRICIHAVLRNTIDYIRGEKGMGNVKISAILVTVTWSHRSVYNLCARMVTQSDETLVQCGARTGNRYQHYHRTYIHDRCMQNTKVTMEKTLVLLVLLIHSALELRGEKTCSTLYLYTTL